MPAKHNRRMIWTAWAVCLSIALGGCGAADRHDAGQTPKPAASSAPAAPVQTSAPAAAAAESVPAKSTAGTTAAQTDTGSTVGVKTTAEAAQPPVKTASNQPAADKPAAADSANRKGYSLMNVRIGESKDSVRGKLGSPKSEYAMDDDEDALSIYDYGTYTIGFTSRGEVEFISVQSKDAPGSLNGVKVGSTSKDAVKSLGEPDTNSGYVLTYKAGGAVLKLDVDPKTDIIHSIKLFRAG